MPLRVGINAVFLEPGMGGLQTYVLQLIPALLDEEPDLALTILANEVGRRLLEAQPWSSDVSMETPRGTRRGLRAFYELGPLGVTAGRRFDVLHSPALTAPLRTRCANVVVLADTTWISSPDTGKGQAPTVRLWQAAVPIVARRADRVIAISAASAADVRDHLGVSPGRIDVIPLGYEARGREKATSGDVLRERFGLSPGPIVLNVAMKKVHKNQARLIRALAQVRRDVPNAQLVLAGARTPYEEVLEHEAREHGVSDAVRILGYVDDAELEGLYGAASAFAFPSLNEGFGLPVLEAMARGVPVVTSNVSAMPEVAGDAAILVDPTSVDDIARGIRQVLDPDVGGRLVEKGLARPGAFTWENTARLTVRSWRRALTRSS